jgi:hypothetical protein
MAAGFFMENGQQAMIVTSSFFEMLLTSSNVVSFRQGLCGMGLVASVLVPFSLRAGARPAPTVAVMVETWHAASLRRRRHLFCRAVPQVRDTDNSKNSIA